MRSETPWAPGSELTCDEFNQGCSYTNFRPRGGGDWLVIYTVAGMGEIVTAQGAFQVGEGDLVMWAPGEMQDYGTAQVPGGPGYWRLQWAHFLPRAEWPEWLHWPMAEHGVRHLHLGVGEVRAEFEAAISRMLVFYRRELPGSVNFAVNALEEALLWAQVVASRDPWLRMDARVRRGVDYLSAHLREPFHLAKLSQHCGLSVSRFAHLFKAETGHTAQQFLEMQRLRHARRLLRVTSLSIGEVAAEVGYADPFYFTNRFTRAEGRSPTEFRRAALGESLPPVGEVM